MCEVASWLPEVEIEDYECRRFVSNPVVNWAVLRQRFGDLSKLVLDERTMWRVKTDTSQVLSLQMELLEFSAIILWRFPAALNQCPFGAVTASIFATCVAFIDRQKLANGPLKPPYEQFLTDLSEQSFVELLARDLAVLLDLAPVHVTAATEWSTFMLLHMYLPQIKAKHFPPAAPGFSPTCAGASVSGYTAERILDLLRRHVPYASGRDIEGLKFLRGLDGVVSATMKDPREFSSTFVQACPAGSASFASAAAMLSLMSNPSLFERFSNLARWIFRSYTIEVLTGATTWSLFHGLAKLGKFALRSFDLVWDPQNMSLVSSIICEQHIYAISNDQAEVVRGGIISVAWRTTWLWQAPRPFTQSCTFECSTAPPASDHTWNFIVSAESRWGPTQLWSDGIHNCGWRCALFQLHWRTPCHFLELKSYIGKCKVGVHFTFPLWTETFAKVLKLTEWGGQTGRLKNRQSDRDRQKAR